MTPKEQGEAKDLKKEIIDALRMIKGGMNKLQDVLKDID